MAGSGAARVRSWAFGLAIVSLVVGGLLTLIAHGNPPDGDYGDIQLPGSQVLHLPAGRVDLNFTEDTDNQTFDVPTELHITITPVAGGPAVPVIVDPDGGAIGINGVTHLFWAAVTVPSDGDYQVSIPDDISPSIPNPHMLFGPHPHPWLGIEIGGGLAVALAITAIVANGAVRRSRPAVATAAQPAFVRTDPIERPRGPQRTVSALLYVTGVDGAPPPYLGLGPVRVTGEIRLDQDGTPRIPVRDYELTAPTAHWPQAGATLPIWLTRADDADEFSFVVLWDAQAETRD